MFPNEYGRVAIKLTEEVQGNEVTEEYKEKIRKVELMVQLKMIEMGVTKKDAYAWCSHDLTHKPLPDNKAGWCTIKLDSELTAEERESLKICKSRWRMLAKSRSFRLLIIMVLVYAKENID
jgi:hypothetical protein